MAKPTQQNPYSYRRTEIWRAALLMLALMIGGSAASFGLVTAVGSAQASRTASR